MEEGNKSPGWTLKFQFKGEEYCLILINSYALVWKFRGHLWES
jgi:hypothetical protein